MQCPNCAKPAPDGAADCGGCGIIFSKWKAREQRAEPAPGAPPAASPEPAASKKRLIGGLVLAAWAAYAAYTYSTMSAKRKEALTRMRAIEAEHRSREAMQRTVREATAMPAGAVEGAIQRLGQQSQ